MRIRGVLTEIKVMRVLLTLLIVGHQSVALSVADLCLTVVESYFQRCIEKNSFSVFTVVPVSLTTRLIPFLM